MPKSINLVCLSLVMASLLASTGCKSLGLDGYTSKVTGEKELPFWKKNEELPPARKPSKIVAIWTNSVLNEAGQEPTRGLGGRVYFYDERHQPVRVDGKMTVFVYDDSANGDRKKQEATDKIHFSPEQVANSYTPSEFGPSYSFWVPWDAVGGDRVQLSVIPVFTSDAGEMLVGEQARYVLPGRKPEALAEGDGENGVVPASFSEEANGKIRLESTTIKVPRSVQRRLKSPSAGPRNRQQSWSRSQQQAAPSNSTSSATVADAGVQLASATSPFVKAKANEKENLGPRYSNLRPSTIKQRSASTPKLNWRTQKTTYDEVARPKVDENGSAQSTGASLEQPTADLQPGSLQAQALQSAQQAAARGPNVLDRAKSLFAR